jgi:hypothetical protein
MCDAILAESLHSDDAEKQIFIPAVGARYMGLYNKHPINK